MMNYLSAFDIVRERWGEDVAEEVLRAEKKEMVFDKFLTYCTACGGNWGGMLLTGIHELWPEVWDVIPDNMDVNCFSTIINLLFCLGVWVDETGE